MTIEAAETADDVIGVEVEAEVDHPCQCGSGQDRDSCDAPAAGSMAGLAGLAGLAEPRTWPSRGPEPQKKRQRRQKNPLRLPKSALHFLVEAQHTARAGRPTSGDTIMTNKYFQILTPSACMPTSCWGRYAHVYVIETDGRPLKVAHPRHAQYIRELWSRERVHVGSTERCAYARACVEAEEYASELEAAGWVRVGVR